MEINVTYHLRKGLKIINKKNKKTKNNAHQTSCRVYGFIR